jgi:hypothetical protein
VFRFRDGEGMGLRGDAGDIQAIVPALVPIAQMNPGSSGATAVAIFLLVLASCTQWQNPLPTRLLSHFQDFGRFVAHPEITQV